MKFSISYLFSPAKHEHVAGTGVKFKGHKLLETQLFTAAIEAIGAVDAPGVVIATRTILHWPQPLRTLRGRWRSTIDGKRVQSRGQCVHFNQDQAALRS